MASISVDHVSKRYESETLLGPGGDAALDDVSLTIADGETVCLVGPSGCGKSTLLRVVAGLESPSSGRVRYDDTDVTMQRPQDRGIGMVFQDYALYPSMKGKGNLQYYFDQHGHTSEQAEARVREVADIMGIGFDLLLGQMPGTLSGGEQQRVAIGRCIVRDPSLFLMDEPICNLDAKLRERTRIEMKRLLRKFAVTALYVTHDQSEAIFMGDRIVVMRDARIAQIGTFDDLYYDPVNLFVATFIGSPPMATVPAVAADGRLRIGATVFPLSYQGLSGAVTVGVRPESWQLGAPGGLNLEIRRIERVPTERTSIVHGDLDVGGTSVKISVVAPLDFGARPTVSVVPDIEACHFFSTTDGSALHNPGVPELF